MKHALNEIIYRFKLNDIIIYAGPLGRIPNYHVDEIINFEQSRLIYRQEAAEAIAFTNVYAKIRYDTRYISL
jgi:hypothetical protein